MSPSYDSLTCTKTSCLLASAQNDVKMVINFSVSCWKAIDEDVVDIIRSLKGIEVAI